MGGKATGGLSVKRIRKTAYLHYVPALIAAVTIALFAGYADWQRQLGAHEAEVAAVSQELTLAKTKLDALISRNVAIAQGLAVDIGNHGASDEKHIQDLVSIVFDLAPQIRNIAVAPNMKVSMVFPLKGNEDVIGLDYNEVPAQRAAVLEVMKTGEPVVTGPVDLVQGGKGLIARFPLIEVDEKGRKTLWGIASAVIEMSRIYRDSGLRIADPDIQIMMRSRSKDGDVTVPFFGDPAIFANHPVKTTLSLGYDTWEMYAIPSDGWDAGSDQAWFRAALLVISLALLIPLIWAGRLMSDRQRHMEALQDREDQLGELSQRLELALESSGIGVWEFNISENTLSWDERMREMYNVPADQLECGYEDWRNALHPDDRVSAERRFDDAINKGSDYSTSFRVVTPEGKLRHVKAMGSVYVDSAKRRKIIGVNWDVTEDIVLQDELRKAKSQTELQNRHLMQAKSSMEHAALHDALTGLANRRFLDKCMQEIPIGSHITVLHIDLDRFKEINDTFGHAAGDLILRETARNLRNLIHDGDFLARIGGDEFVVISGVNNSDKDYASVANALVEAMSRPIIFEGHECRVGASIGFASGNTASEPAGQILINADIALYEAKRRGRNRVEPFTERLRQVAIHNKRIADDILRAFEQDQFVAYYQPQFCAQTREINGFEALVRWIHPEKGLLAPDAFLQIAENLKVVSTIDALVLEQAHQQFLRLRASGVDIPKFSVNLSAQRLKEEALFEKIASMPLLPGSLSVELLESISFEGDDEELVKQTDRLRDMGIDIEIDDFGTGHASILTLLKLMPRRLKIDRELVFPIVESSNQRALVRSIIDIGRARGIEIIAEGVETMQHAVILRDLGCHSLQGYAFAHPMSGQEFLNFARKRPWLAA
ncbi:EAL domain-containing protein [Rhizobium sp. L1K21]|uniref:bifunctional diguanylate cyclase/phosphodiesterase n=1 Tax=Rhizobium sp. L1K21 TaxID=2954933 RepID=UPI002093D219|nr:EAL domain-containing protein [Rhizobium sp. L1K21]MCO6187353.1 EAL domain-containing protein [Rhizobium sp. L1K21]